MSITDADRIAADGIPLTLADGRNVRLRYGFRGLRALERDFGSLGAVNAAMEAADYDPLARALAAGLLHEGIDSDTIDDLLDSRRLHEYEKALMDALDEALPPVAEGKAPGADSPFRGEPSTTPPPVSVGTTNGSGT